MEIPKSLNLWSSNGDHAGFMLIASESNSTTGECVFMLTPVSAKGIDSSLGIVVSELKSAGEHKLRILEKDKGCTITIYPEGFPEVVMEFNEKFEGEIHTEFNDEYQCIGTAQPLDKNA